MNQEFNRYLATMLRQVGEIRENSWRDDGDTGGYTKSYGAAMTEAGIDQNDPIRYILDCLFTAGYVDMWAFCDDVLGQG